MKNCPDCKEKIRKKSLKFCENCFHSFYNNLKLNTKQKINSYYYFLKKVHEEFGPEEIKDEDKEIIGIIKYSINNFKKKIIEIQDINGKNLVILKFQKVFFSTVLDLYDDSENLIARIKKEKFSFLNPKIFLENIYGTKKYIALGNLKNWTFKIIDASKNKIVAEVKNNDIKQISSSKKILKIQEYYCLKINNAKSNSLILLSFTIAINNIFHTISGLTNITGIERKVARLRPFGPGNPKFDKR